MWLKVEGFKEMIANWWSCYQFDGTASFVIEQKLKCLKADLKKWNIEIFGRIEQRKKKLEQEIVRMDRLDDEGKMTEEERRVKSDLLTDLNNVIQMEETSWRQRSRVQWLKEGDRNTKYFHKMASANRRRNWISSLSIEGRITEDTEKIKDHIVEYYNQLFREECSWRPHLDYLETSRLEAEVADRLELQFTEQEIYQALHELSGDKAPGPDGWSLAFFQHCWDIIKVDVMKLFDEFYHTSRFVRSLNCTFIALIPKINGAVHIKDYRPISLVGAIYKLLAKVLANRIKRVMDLLISENQNAFVSGRQILDAVLVANEAIDTTLRNKESGIICKMDIEKAYDHVNWNFLLYWMRKMGFGERWCNWMEWCISTVSFSVLINGSPAGFFQSSRGLRQGDPLSPFLFILVMEALSLMIRRMESAGLLKGITVGHPGQHSVSISHLLFADDTLVFCGNDRLQLGFLRCVMLGFEAVSGLKVNLNKTELIPVGRVDNCGNLAAVLDCRTGSLPSTYLGMPLGAKFKNKDVWEKVIERSRKRLSDWQQIYLSKGAKVTLIKSVLFSLPSYLLSLFIAPQSVLKELEKIQRDFLWGRKPNTFKYNLVDWKTVCSCLKSGGVGIKDLKLQNQALLGKWLWRFSAENSSLWKRFIIAKYGEERGGWYTARCFKSYGVSLWKGIMKIWPQFKHCIAWQLGRGDRILFWKHRWMEIGVLAEVFPDIYAIAADDEALVSDYHVIVGHNSVWHIELRRNVNDWELVSYLQLLELLYSISWTNTEDRLIWKDTRNKVYNVSSFYGKLKGDNLDSFPWNKIWKTVANPRVSFFAWCAAQGKVLTIDNLQIRGHSLVNRCVLCLCKEESIDHLFIHCSWTSEIWSFVLACFGVLSCPPKDLKSFLLAWWGQPMAKHRKEVWNLVPLCLLWMVWKERNRRTFEDKGSTTVKLKSMFFNSLFSWANGGREVDVNALMLFIESLSLAGM